MLYTNRRIDNHAEGCGGWKHWAESKTAGIWGKELDENLPTRVVFSADWNDTISTHATSNSLAASSRLKSRNHHRRIPSKEYEMQIGTRMVKTVKVDKFGECELPWRNTFRMGWEVCTCSTALRNMRYDDIFISSEIIHDTRKFGCLTWNCCLAIAFSDRHVGLPRGTFVQDVYSDQLNYSIRSTVISPITNKTQKMKVGSRREKISDKKMFERIFVS